MHIRNDETVGRSNSKRAPPNYFSSSFVGNKEGMGGGLTGWILHEGGAMRGYKIMLSSFELVMLLSPRSLDYDLRRFCHHELKIF